MTSLPAAAPQVAPSRAALRRDAGGPIEVMELGTLPYRQAWTLQQRLVADRQEGRIRDTVVMLEHPPVYTSGRRADPSHILLDGTELERSGIDVVEVDRGGDVTYHGPGQLVVYPIVALEGTRRVVDFVRALEEVAIHALGVLGVPAARREGLTGVWVGREKLVAIGVRVGALGVTSHGLALNVAPDLTHFAGIVPCGLSEEGVCSLESLGAGRSMDEVRAAVREGLAEVLAAELIDVPGRTGEAA